MKTAIWYAIALLLASCGARRHVAAPLSEIEGDTVDISFRAERSALPIYIHKDNLYLLGEEGIEYGICLRNQAPVRIEAVVSVDGRDAVSGRVADYRTDRGYVLEPQEETCIRGFRESTESVAAFTFTSVEQSYAARMGTAENVGVIGIAVFDEASAPQPPQVIARDEDARMYSKSAPTAEADGARIEEEGAEIGTEYGRSVASQVEIIPFVRRDPERPRELRAVFYDNREGLESRGIRVSDGDRPSPEPNPFPGSESGFAPPPHR